MERRLKVSFGPEKWKIVTALCITFAVLIFAIAYYLYDSYTVTEVSVTGNRHYTSEQIQEMVMTGALGHNSLYLSLKYRDKPVKDVPFVETMDVDILSPTSISISVYEKTIAGCVEYLDRYIYFDKDGIVVESSTIRQSDVPLVTGLEFDHVVLYDRLPVAKEEIFKDILNMTQLLAKYSIGTDQIYFDSEEELSLYFKNARVLLGSMENIDEKMLKLQGIIPQLDGLDGTLFMNNYTSDADDDCITFQRNDVKQHANLDLTESSLSENDADSALGDGGEPLNDEASDINETE